jgi:hypothetical protein
MPSVMLSRFATFYERFPINRKLETGIGKNSKSPGTTSTRNNKCYTKH